MKILAARDTQAAEVRTNMIKPKIKKPKPSTGVVIAIKKSDRAQAWMPSEVIVSLDGEVAGQLLCVCGWTMTTTVKDKACRKWPLPRLQKNLGRVAEEWAEDFGKSWRLEIRSTVDACS